MGKTTAKENDSMKQNKWQMPTVIIMAFIAFALLNSIFPIKSANEKVKDLISRHKAVLIMVKNYTEKDKEFLKAIREVRPLLKGKAGIVITNKKSGYNVGYTQSDDELPLLIIFGAHGEVIQIFKGSIDKKLLKEAVDVIATHSH